MFNIFKKTAAVIVILILVLPISIFNSPVKPVRAVLAPPGGGLGLPGEGLLTPPTGDVTTETKTIPAYDFFSGLGSSGRGLGVCGQGGGFLGDLVSGGLGWLTGIVTAPALGPASVGLGVLVQRGTSFLGGLFGGGAEQACEQAQQAFVKALWAAAKKQFLDQILNDTVYWIQNVPLKTEDGQYTWPQTAPAFVERFDDYLKAKGDDALGDFALEFADNFSGEFIAGMDPTKWLCSPFQLQLKLGFVSLPGPFQTRITCTVSDIFANFDNFWTNFGTGGWLKYQQMWEPNNNYYGALILTFEESTRREVNAKSGGLIDALAGGGFLGVKVCEKSIVAETARGPDGQPIIGPDGQPVLTPLDPPRCIKEKTVSPGKALGDYFSTALSSNIWTVVMADDVSAYTEALVGALTNRIVEFGAEGLKDLFAKAKERKPQFASAPASQSVCDRFTGELKVKCEETVASSEADFPLLYFTYLDKIKSFVPAQKELLDALGEVGVAGTLIDITAHNLAWTNEIQLAREGKDIYGNDIFATYAVDYYEDPVSVIAGVTEYLQLSPQELSLLNGQRSGAVLEGYRAQKTLEQQKLDLLIGAGADPTKDNTWRGVYEQILAATTMEELSALASNLSAADADAARREKERILTDTATRKSDRTLALEDRNKIRTIYYKKGLQRLRLLPALQAVLTAYEENNEAFILLNETQTTCIPNKQNTNVVQERLTNAALAANQSKNSIQGNASQFGNKFKQEARMHLLGSNFTLRDDYLFRFSFEPVNSILDQLPTLDRGNGLRLTPSHLRQSAGTAIMFGTSINYNFHVSAGGEGRSASDYRLDAPGGFFGAFDDKPEIFQYLEPRGGLDTGHKHSFPDLNFIAGNAPAEISAIIPDLEVSKNVLTAMQGLKTTVNSQLQTARNIDAACLQLQDKPEPTE